MTIKKFDAQQKIKTNAIALIKKDGMVQNKKENKTNAIALIKKDGMVQNKKDLLNGIGENKKEGEYSYDIDGDYADDFIKDNIRQALENRLAKIVKADLAANDQFSTIKYNTIEEMDNYLLIKDKRKQAKAIKDNAKKK